MALALSATGGMAALPAKAADTTIGNGAALTFYLQLQHPAAAEAAAKAIQTPGSATYHKFLTLAQFVRQYAPTDAQISQVKTELAALGYTVSYVFPNHLAVQAIGPSSPSASVLGMHMRSVTANGRTGVIPDRMPVMPASLASLVRDVGGLDTVHVARPMRVRAGMRPAQATAAPRAASGKLTGGTPGNYLPADYAARYDVNPLYQVGLTGRGTTLAIVTLANFKTSDTLSFWNGIGVNASSSRLRVVDVDGGTSVAPSDALGEGETDLDTQESGGLAPGANVRVYVSQNNTTAQFIDGFEAVASENIADTVSTSWGEAELDFFAQPAIGQPDLTTQLQDFHEVFLEMALQGQTLYAASGDSGAFDTVDECPASGTPSATTPVCSSPYAVDSPANDPLVTAAGGTTTPFSYPSGDGYTFSVTNERAWAWDYLAQEDPKITTASVFSTGDGGGVSSYWTLPWYETGQPGITATKSGQVYTQNIGARPVTLVTLPSGFKGRNMPDISTDADPQSGYQYIEEGAIQNFYGGTSFVAPQLNGVTSLFVQELGGRVGQISPAIYEFQNITTRDITYGDNWGYNALSGYDNATGMGVLDATGLLIGLEVVKLYGGSL
jgi:subtilase family serine protease